MVRILLDKEEQKIQEKLRVEAEDFSVPTATNQLVVTDEAASADTSKTDLSGETKIDGYELEEIIGTGSTGVVYRAHDVAGTKVALKLFRKELVPDVEAVKRFNKEIGTLQKLSHPNIVKMLAHGNSPSGAPYTVMELVGGKSIKQTLEGGNVFQPHTTAAIMRDVCRALSAAHAETVIHRDLTPANIIVGSDNVAKVVDFGIAKAVGYSGETLTQLGAVVGTPAYMSPEQCLGNSVDARSDIYSLGCTMFEMITGIKAFNSNNPVEAIAKQMSDDRSHIPKTLDSSSIPKDIQAIIIKCLHKKPEQRYQTVAELDHDLSAFVLSKPLPYANVDSHEKAVWQKLVMIAAAGTLVAFIAYVVLVGNIAATMQMPMPFSSMPQATFSPSLPAIFDRIQNVEIKNKFSDRVIFSTDAKSWAEVFRKASEKKVSLKEANLRGANLENADLRDLDLSSADLTGVNFKDANLVNVDFSNARLIGANFQKTTLDKVNFTKAYLSSSNFTGASGKWAMLQDADLTAATMINSDFNCANFEHAKLKNAILTSANFSTTNCIGANFERANLDKANFRDAKLEFANLTGALGQEVQIDNVNFSGTSMGSFKLERQGIMSSNVRVRYSPQYPTSPDYAYYEAQRRSAEFRQQMELRRQQLREQSRLRDIERMRDAERMKMRYDSRRIPTH